MLIKGSQPQMNLTVSAESLLRAGDKEAVEWWMKVPKTSRFVNLADERAWQGAWQMKASIGLSE